MFGSKPLYSPFKMAKKSKKVIDEQPKWVYKESDAGAIDWRKKGVETPVKD